MPSTARYPGDKVDDLKAMAQTGHLFGPDICGPARPGEVLGQGAYYELTDAEYDPAADRTTAQFRPHIPPAQRARIRYYGGDTAADAQPDVIGTPTLHESDHIEER